MACANDTRCSEEGFDFYMKINSQPSSFILFPKFVLLLLPDTEISADVQT